MERNLYSPPSAPVSDISNSAVAAERPHQVSTAVLLLCLSLALGQVTSALLRQNLPHNAAALFVEVFTVASLAWLTYKIRVGRNWARMTFSVLDTLRRSNVHRLSSKRTWAKGRLGLRLEPVAR